MWDLLVYNPDGSFRVGYTPESPIERLAWSVTGDGDCLEGLIVGVGLDLRPRDIVSIRSVRSSDEDFTTSAKPRYLGWVVTAGDSRSPELSEWRLRGGSQRLREIVNRQLRIPGGDVATMARATLNAQVPPPMEVDPDLFPALGFELGARDPHFETLGETLDALMEAAPAFTLSPGDPNYMYDGQLFSGTNPGHDYVPPTRWGVDAEGQVFFRRNPTWFINAVYEESGATIEWEPASADVVVDSVVVVVADRPTEGVKYFKLLTSTFEPLAHVLEHGLDEPYGAWTKVTYQSMDALRPAAWSAAAFMSTGWVNLNNAFDSNPASYARNAGGSSLATFGRRMNVSARAVKIRLSSHNVVNVLWTYEQLPLPAPTLASYSWNIEPTDGQQQDFLFVAPKVVGENPTHVRLIIQAVAELPDALTADAVRVYDVQPYQLDDDLLDRVARSHLRPPSRDVAAITVPDTILTPRRQASWNVEPETTTRLTALVYEYSITRETGLQTVIRTGQELPAPLQGERDMLDRRSKQDKTPRGALRLTL